MDNTFFDFIIYCAFEDLLTYGNKTSLTIDKIHEFREFVLNEIEGSDFIKSFCNDSSEDAESVAEFIKSNREMRIEDEFQKLKEFLYDNSDYFYLDGNLAVNLRTENISSKEEFSELKFELDSYKENERVLGFIIGLTGSLKTTRLLGATNYENSMKVLINHEKKTEELYKNYSDENTQEQIDKYQLFSKECLNRLYKLSHYESNGYLRLLYDVLKEKNLKHELNNLINTSVLKMDDFYNDNYSMFDFRISNGFINNGFYHAIFSDYDLYPCKTDNYISDLEELKRPPLEDDDLDDEDDDDYDDFLDEKDLDDDEYEEEYQDEFDEFYGQDEYDDDLDDREYFERELKRKLIFNLKYIQTIDKLQNEIGKIEEFENIKTRLIYLFDNHDYKLYKEHNRNQMFNYLKNNDFTDMNYRKDFDDFYTSSRILFTEMINNTKPDKLKLRKILFVVSYYNLTNDERIEKMIEKYKDTNIGSIIYDMTLNENNLDNGKTKNLIKKYINKNN